MEKIIGKCKVCGHENTVEISDALYGEFRRIAIGAISAGVMCDRCYELESERRAASELSEKRRSVAQTAGVPLEATQWNAEMATPEQREFAKRIYTAGVIEGKSMLIAGRSRAGKTRAVCRSAWHMIERGKLLAGDVKYFQAAALRKAIGQAARSDDGWAERDFYDSLLRARLLIIDDLDKGQWTPASLEGLFRIIDDRVIRPQLKTWITTNVDATALVGRLAGNNADCGTTAVALVARLREMCVELQSSNQGATNVN